MDTTIGDSLVSSSAARLEGVHPHCCHPADNKAAYDYRQADENHVLRKASAWATMRWGGGIMSASCRHHVGIMLASEQGAPSGRGKDITETKCSSSHRRTKYGTHQGNMLVLLQRTIYVSKLRHECGGSDQKRHAGGPACVLKEVIGRIHV